jgi:hypothetical protein
MYNVIVLNGGDLASTRVVRPYGACRAKQGARKIKLVINVDAKNDAIFAGNSDLAIAA